MRSTAMDYLWRARLHHIKRGALAARFRHLSDLDLETSSLFLQALKNRTVSKDPVPVSSALGQPPDSLASGAPLRLFSRPQ